MKRSERERARKREKRSAKGASSRYIRAATWAGRQAKTNGDGQKTKRKEVSACVRQSSFCHSLSRLSWLVSQEDLQTEGRRTKFKAPMHGDDRDLLASFGVPSK